MVHVRLDEAWRDYPGPVLSSWTQLDDYLNNFRLPAATHNGEVSQTVDWMKIEELRQRVQRWYDGFWNRIRAQLYTRLSEVWDLVIPTSSPVKENMTVEEVLNLLVERIRVLEDRVQVLEAKQQVN